MQTLDGLTKFDEQLKAMPELLNNLKGTIDTVNGYMKSANESVGKLDGYLKTSICRISKHGNFIK